MSGVSTSYYIYIPRLFTHRQDCSKAKATRKLQPSAVQETDIPCENKINRTYFCMKPETPQSNITPTDTGG